MREFKSNVQRKLEAKNAKPIVYDFLVPVSEYITKVYSEIEEDLTRDDYAEIAREIRENNDLVIRHKDDTISVVARDHGISQYSQYSRWDDGEDIIKKRKEEPIKLTVSFIQKHTLESGGTPNWIHTTTVELSNLYYVTDYNKLSSYILDNIKKESEKAIEDIKEEAKGKIEKVSKAFTDLKTFNIKTLDFNALETERTVKELRDPKTSAKRVLEITAELAYDEDRY